MSRPNGRLRRLLSVAAIAAVAGSLLASPAAADHQCSQAQAPLSEDEVPVAPKNGTLVAECMDASQVQDPPGSDSPGTGTATIWISLDQDVIAHQVHTDDLTLPIHGAIVYKGGEGEQGSQHYALFSRTDDPNPIGCRFGIEPELRELLQKSKPFYLEIYDDLWRDGAIRGQLVYTYKYGTPPSSVC